MTDAQLRMECLRLAKEMASDPETMLQIAAKLYQFVSSGRS
jgi:hypothetical protein